jgi:choline dehydrogenase-like flavoprotein
MNKAVGTGTLTLRDTDPHSLPIIDPKYLEHPDDMRTLLEGIKFSVNLVDNTKAMQDIGARLFRLPFPGCERHTFKSDAYFECLGRHTTLSAFKYCGTAPIGTKDDPEAVVDSRFR